MRVTYWRLPRTPRRAADAALAVAARTLRELGAWGAYPWRDLQIVDWRSGMEHAGLVFAAPRADLVAHEVAHQWFWALVGSDQYAHPWLDESLAQYATDRVLRRTERRPPRSDAELAACPMPAPGHAGLPMSVWARRPHLSYSQTVYHGGACVLRHVEAAWGRAGIDAALRRHLAEHRLGEAEPADLLAAFRAAGAPESSVRLLTSAFGVVGG